MKLYCIFDTVAEEGGPIFEARNDNMARRIYDNIKEFPPGSVKSDFRLIKLGCYNRGDSKERPYILAKEKAQDITYIAHNEEETA